MTKVLAGDIGGTKTILRLTDLPSKGKASLFQEKYPSAKYPDLVPMVREFLAAAETALGEKQTPEKACFAIAGPVVNNTAKLTNLPWLLEAHRLERDLGISKVSLINDFAAVGYGVVALESEDIHTLQAGQFDSKAPIAIIGAGTGLGQCFGVPQGENYHIFSTEGGHTDFAPRNQLEFDLLEYLLDKYGITRISVERVVSGQGIVAIYQFLRDRQGSHNSEVAEIVRTWEQQAGRKQKTVDPAAAISSAALEKTDDLSEETMQIFVEAYGAEAGNLALKFLPYGGLYVAGGIAAKILPLIQEDNRFMQAFTHKGRVSGLVERVPVRLVLNPEVGLIGAASYAAQL